MHRAQLSRKIATLGAALALGGCTSLRDHAAETSFPRLETESPSLFDGRMEGVFPAHGAAKPGVGELLQMSAVAPQDDIIDLGAPAGPAASIDGEIIGTAEGGCANGQCAVGGPGGAGGLFRRRGPSGKELLDQSGANITSYTRKLRGDMGNNPQQPRELRMASHPLYVVEPPDILYIEALDAAPNQPVQGERLVRPDGTISLGYYGQIHVAGLTLPEIERKLRAALEKRVQNPQVYVDVVSFNSKVFYVLGQVQNQGRLPITG